jgi:hypothetical protein
MSAKGTKISYEEARKQFPRAFEELEKIIGAEFELDPAGYDVFFKTRKGNLIYGNTLDDNYDIWNGKEWQGYE